MEAQQLRSVRAVAMAEARQDAEEQASKLAQQRREAAERRQAAERAAQERADRSTPPVAESQQTAPPAPSGGSLHTWITDALAVMRQHNIPGSYAGIHRNIMRESGGDPNAINNWDINAQNGTPSIGLLQVIRPTFEAYHVPGTSWSQYDPVANIAAACNYAAARYGSIDNVNGAY